MRAGCTARNGSDRAMSSSDGYRLTRLPFQRQNSDSSKNGTPKYKNTPQQLFRAPLPLSTFFAKAKSRPFRFRMWAATRMRARPERGLFLARSKFVQKSRKSCPLSSTRNPGKRVSRVLVGPTGFLVPLFQISKLRVTLCLRTISKTI